MARIDVSRIPDVEGTDLASARRWFATLASMGARFHADDPADTATFTPEAADKVNAAMARLHEGCKAWPDPGFIYDLAGEGRFKVEDDYPGFLLDASIPAAARTGYSSMPGQDYPTLAVEELSRFVAVQVLQREGPLSACRRFRAVPLEGAFFEPGGPSYIDTAGATLLTDLAVEADSLADLEDAIVEAAKAASARSPGI